jgi:hypothetical protein
VKICRFVSALDSQVNMLSIHLLEQKKLKYSLIMLLPPFILHIIVDENRWMEFPRQERLKYRRPDTSA